MSIPKMLFTLYTGIMIAVDSIFDFIIELAQKGVDILPNGVMQDLIDNIYVLLSVVMVFYSIIALLTYLVDPNKLTNKNSTGSKLIINVVVTLALLVFTPTIFKIAQDLQTAILNEDILGKIVFGSEVTSDDSSQTSDMLVVGITRAVLTPSDPNPNDKLYSEDFFAGGVERRIEHISELDYYANNSTDYTFNWFVGFGCGVLIILVLFNFCFDIAIRISKLAFLEVIAPFPIIANILPNKKKNMLSNWISECTSCYLGLFLRIAVLYLAIYIMTKVSLNFPSDGNFLIVAMFYVGLMLFIKEAPKLISEIFGIKSSGSFSLNPMDRIREVPILGKGVQTAGAAIGGLATGAALGYRASGGFKGIAQGFKDDKGNFNFKGGMKNLGSRMATVGKSVGKSASLGTVYGGRAGWQQVAMGGISKDKKPKTTAYKAGATSVAQAITGDEKATSGVIDRVFNNMGTELNKPMYEQHKRIDDAKKSYDKQVQHVTMLEQQEIELQQKLGVEQKRNVSLNTQLSSFNADSEVKTFDDYHNYMSQFTKINNDIAAAKASGDNSALVQAQSDYKNLQTSFNVFKKQNPNVSSIVSNVNVQNKVQQRDELQIRVNESNEILHEIETQHTKVKTDLGTKTVYKTNTSGEYEYNPDGSRVVLTPGSGARKTLDDMKDNQLKAEQTLRSMQGPYQKNK